MIDKRLPKVDWVNGGSGEFSVVQFFKTGEYEYVRRWVDAEEAKKAVLHYTSNVAVKMGIIDKVIITDGGDHTVFEWVHGKGITFPPEKEERKK